MTSTALLLLTAPPSSLTLPKITQLLRLCAKHVTRRMYVQLEPNSNSSELEPDTPGNLAAYCEIATLFYAHAPLYFPSVNVNVLLAPCKAPIITNLKTRFPFDLILSDQTQAKTLSTLQKRFNQSNLGEIPVVTSNDLIQGLENVQSTQDSKRELPWTVHKKVVMGGTFDRLHNGHKVLLTHAILKCNEQLTIGVTNGPINKRKTLKEMIEPTQNRIEKLREFLEEIDPTLDYKIVEITDTFGPSTVDPELTCIVVSAETLKGGQMVNEEREKKGMRPLEIYVVDLIEDNEHRVHEEIKFSSSSLRMRLLGERIRQPKPNSQLLPLPYVVGLTGGIASGKSSIAERLGKLGAHIINCDKLGHLTYQKGLPAYQKIIETFGKDQVLLENGDINRRALGAIVFSNKESLEKLSAIVWPEIAKLVQQQIEGCRQRGVRVVILDAAVLLEAAWNHMCHEIWVSVIPPDEAIRRIQARDGLSTSDAEKRIESQISNEARVAAANVVFSTFWEPEYTQQQVEKMWNILQEELNHSSL